MPGTLRYFKPSLTSSHSLSLSSHFGGCRTGRRCSGFETVCPWSRDTPRIPMLVKSTIQVLEKGTCHSLAKSVAHELCCLQLIDFHSITYVQCFLLSVCTPFVHSWPWFIVSPLKFGYKLYMFGHISGVCSLLNSSYRILFKLYLLRLPGLIVEQSSEQLMGLNLQLY